MALQVSELSIVHSSAFPSYCFISVFHFFCTLVPPDQNLALLQFKSMISLNNCTSENPSIKNLSGLNPRKIQSWKEGTDCCLWDGVSCDNVTVPQEISHLSKLVSLDLSFNSLYLETPAMKTLVQNMTKLRVVTLTWVGMKNVAPHSLVNLSSSLTSLSLDFCYLGGEFPVSVFQLPNLQNIQISYNPMIVHFPKSNWTSPIKFLEVVDTGLAVKIPYSVGDLKNLEFLYVEGKGELPDSIGNLLSLKCLNLLCTFTGSIPTSIGNLTQITKINLPNSSFRGELPLSLGKLQNLEHLDLENNNFTGQFPNAFTNLTKLSIINLPFNNFNGKLPFSLFNLTQPIGVDFSHNQLTGPIPSDINSHAGLVLLDISHNLLKGAVPSGLFVLPLLNTLDLSYNQLDGHIHDFQVNSSQLSDVDISYNKLHGPIPRPLFELEHLTGLSLSSNNMTGFLDLEMISQLTNSVHSICHTIVCLEESSLTNLNLSYKFLTSFSKYPWKMLEMLDLRSNLLEGSLPALLPSTWFLYLSKNKLSGEIPPSLCNGSYLEILDLSNNNLNGRIPHCLGNLRYLPSVLDLRMNKFHGGIPEFANCEALTTLGLNGNQLEGVLPRSILNCKKLEVLDIGNNRITV
ncbi:hypothetical protein DITRI_Ditri02bG0163000 [Diplodiscus trichospermus]